MKRKQWFAKCMIITLAIVFTLGSCSSIGSKHSTEPITITFIETSDIHGAIFPYDFITGNELPTSMAHIASFVSEKRNNGEHIVLMDNGDSLQGQPTVYYYNFQKTDVTHIHADVLNYLQYDVVGMGNHDIEAGHPVYDRLVKEVNAPIICANLEIEGTGKPYFEPYTIIERQGLKIAVLGLLEPKITEQLPKAFWSGIDVMDMVETAKKWVPIIQKKEKPDLLVGLFHAGVDYTYGGQTADTPNNESASQLVAERVPGFDIIFVGHDHQGWEGTGFNPVSKQKDQIVTDPNGKVVPIFGPVGAAQNIAVVEVEMKWDKTNKKWDKTISGKLVPVADFPIDKEFSNHFASAKEELMDWVERPIGKMIGQMHSDDALFGDSAFVDLIHRIQLELCNDPEMGLEPAQISIAAPLDQNAYLPTTSDGTIKVRDMFSLYKFENFMYTMNLTGKQIKDFLEFNYGLQFNQMTNQNDHLLAFKKDADGKMIYNARYNSYDTATRPYNYDSFAGIDYIVDVSKPSGSRVTISSMSDGTKFDMDKTYSVAINSYRAAGGGSHLTKGVGLPSEKLQKLELVTSSTTKDLRFYMLKWFEKQPGAIEVKRDNNWKVIPEDWAEQGRKKDYPLMYPNK